MTEASHTMKLAGACAPWVFANAGAHGYYRTAYPSEMLRTLAPYVATDLSAPERQALGCAQIGRNVRRERAQHLRRVGGAVVAVCASVGKHPRGASPREFHRVRSLCHHLAAGSGLAGGLHTDRNLPPPGLGAGSVDHEALLPERD